MSENLRKDLISSLRGFFTVPLFTFLYKNKIIEKLQKNKKLSLNDNHNIKNKTFLKIALTYLSNLNILNERKNIFYLTKYGQRFLKRIGTFLILNSYKPYLDNLEYLSNDKRIKVKCDRDENVLGSSLAHNKKFFKHSFEIIKRNKYDLIIDIACGDGNYIKIANQKRSKANFLAVDLSPIALSCAKKNNSKSNISYYLCDGKNVKKWSKKALSIVKDKNAKILVTMWFFTHEITNNNTSNLKNLFQNIKSNFKNCEIIVGEIFRQNKNILSKNKDISIMPEFLFFHDLSGQGILKFNEYKKTFKELKIDVKKEYLIDNFKINKKNNPTAAVWHLKI